MFHADPEELHLNYREEQKKYTVSVEGKIFSASARHINTYKYNFMTKTRLKSIKPESNEASSMVTITSV